MTSEDKKEDILDKIAEIYTWFEVVVASFIVGLIVAFAIYFSRPNSASLYFAITSIILSLIVGRYLANKNRKGKNKI